MNTVDAIEILKEKRKIIKLRAVHDGACAPTPDEIAIDIAIKHMEWIPCSERLPEFDEVVQIWLKNSTYAQCQSACRQSWEAFNDPWNWEATATNDVWWKQEDVSHWRPDSEGPEKRDEE